MNHIDYMKLGYAQELYRKMGYQPIEVPWRVSVGILDVTRPKFAIGDYVIEGTEKGLIASGEQGFMTMMNKGMLPPGLYQTVTPCFRNERYDDTHSKQFMKLELITVLNEEAKFEADAMAQQAANCAMNVFDTIAPGIREYLAIVKQDVQDPLLLGSQYDIEFTLPDRIVELGSYGVRRAFFGTWVYGTGLAEPRFSKALAAHSPASLANE